MYWLVSLSLLASIGTCMYFRGDLWGIPPLYYGAGILGAITLARGAAARFNTTVRRAVEFVMRLPVACFVLSIAGLAAVLSATWVLVVFQGVPHHIDGVAQLFQAKIFASGALAAPPPEFPEFFGLSNMVINERWYSQYPPGYALHLVVGQLMAIPWVVNTVAFAVSVWVLYLVARELIDEQCARLAAVLFGLSPWAVLVSASHMSHVVSTTWILAGALAAVRARKIASTSGFALSGACCAVALLTRPFTMLCSAAAFAVLLVLYRRPAWRKWLVECLLFSGMLSLGLDALLVYNRLTTGEWFTLGYTQNFGREHFVGFGISPFSNIGDHSIAAAGAHLWRRCAEINQGLLLLPGAAAPLCAVGAIVIRPWSVRVLLLALPAALLAGHFLYFWKDSVYGARFIFEGSAFLAVLSAAGLRWLVGVWYRVSAARSEVVLGGIAALALLGVVLSVDEARVKYAHGYNGFADDFGDVERDLRDDQRLAGFVHPAYYPLVFSRNTPDLASPVIWCLDRGADNHRLLERSARLGFRTNGHNVEWITESKREGRNGSSRVRFEIEGAGLSSPGPISTISHVADSEWWASSGFSRTPLRPGEEAVFEFDLDTRGELQLEVGFVTSLDGGRGEVRFDGTPVGVADWKYYRPTGRKLSAAVSVTRPGRHELVVRALGRGERALGFGLDYVDFDAAPRGSLGLAGDRARAIGGE